MDGGRGRRGRSHREGRWWVEVLVLRRGALGRLGDLGMLRVVGFGEMLSLQSLGCAWRLCDEA